MLYLEDDLEKEPSVDTLDEEWAKFNSLELGGVNVKIEIFDNARKINFYKLVDKEGKVDETVSKQLRRLMKFLGHEDRFVDMMVDYVDKDILGQYELGARNQMVFSLDELNGIKDMPREVLYGGTFDGVKKKGIMEFLTLVKEEEKKDEKTEEPAPPSPEPSPEKPPEDEKKKKEPQSTIWRININTAPLEVLVSISDEITEDIARNIINYRESRKDDKGKLICFRNVEEVKNVQGMTSEIYEKIKGVITVKSDYFSIKVKSTCGSIEKGWIYLINRKDGVKLESSQQLNEFLGISVPKIETK
jgi:type II secretory pathway component PulK